LAVQVQERSGQSFAQYRRALTEAQVNLQSTHEDATRRYASALRQASPQTTPSELNDINQAFQQACTEAQTKAQASADTASEQLSSAMAKGTDEANRQWDAACASYVGALKERVASLDPASADPAIIGALGASFAWISRHIRGPTQGAA